MADEKKIISPDTKRQNRVPPGQRSTTRFPTLSIEGAPEIDPGSWTLSIFGAVKKKKRISHKAFMALPRVTVYADVHCVTGWTHLGAVWEGVSTASIKDLADILPEARFVMVWSSDGYSTNLTLDDFFQPDVLLARGVDGEALEAGHGAPVRLVVPRLYFYKSAKRVSGLEFMLEDRKGYWESRGYHNHADPWKEERYDR